MVGSTHACAVLTIVYIIERTNSNYVPTDRIAMTHVQPGKVAIFIAINGRNPVASPETGIKFVRHYFCGIIGIGSNIVIQKPALVLVHHREKKKKFFIEVFPLHATSH